MLENATPNVLNGTVEPLPIARRVLEIGGFLVGALFLLRFGLLTPTIVLNLRLDSDAQEKAVA
ncbi:hypothetical protein Thi970DRAFT_00719 [Thiorhodovibrio frisius]|uniref:Uncharacterized protein n=1 Tax=Thiorhodovibrio frisius TaxID=631362 RepID=H8YX92_9GAMM|nr:hypothetical protein Thi970DRAFT_00719 [Thiorhodovibrio frisius]WPL22667.1 hypothetical protein Thiofri_02837 [Thiorhodovibrio frisius]